MNEKLNNLLHVIKCCVSSSYHGQLVINFNQGGICQPLFKTGKADVDFDTEGFSGKITTTYKDGCGKKLDIREEVWLTERNGL